MAKNLDFTHDATLLYFEFLWKDGTVRLHLKIHDNSETVITVNEVKSIQITREFEWGESQQINSVVTENEEIIIEMQSGDFINIIGKIQN